MGTIFARVCCFTAVVPKLTSRSVLFIVQVVADNVVVLMDEKQKIHNLEVCFWM